MVFIRIPVVFFILYVLPFYPHYRNCIHFSFRRVLSVMVFSILFGMSVNDDVQAVCLPLLCVAAYADMQYGEIPDMVPVLIFGAGLLKMHAENASAAFLMLFALLPFAMKEKIGFGDVKMICAWALLEGQKVFAGCAAASVVCLCFLHLKKGSSIQIIPFGPFLSFGFLITLF